MTNPEFAAGDDYVLVERLCALIEHHCPPGGELVLELGRCSPALASLASELGFSYGALTNDEKILETLEGRGVDASLVDLGEVEATLISVEASIGERRLAAIVCSGVLEELAEPQALLAALGASSTRHERAPLLVAIPNLGHLDIAAKLLLGRFDVTDAGLLARANTVLFTAARLRATTAAAGWQELAANDLAAEQSDQHFPLDLASLARSSPLHRFLAHLRTRAGEGAQVTHFVRAYVPTTRADEPARSPASSHLLSVLMRTQATRLPLMHDALLSLAAQSSQDFELLVLAHDVRPEDETRLQALLDSFELEDAADRVRIIPVAGGGRAHPLNVGAAAARGEYVVVLDDDDVVFGHWVETFARLAREHPGAVLRSVCALQTIAPVRWPTGEEAFAPLDAPSMPWSRRFDLIEHLSMNQTPSCTYAIPRSCFLELGIAYDEELSVVEDWDVLLQSAILCGVAESNEVTALYRRSDLGDSSFTRHIPEEWDRAQARMFEKLDREPLLLPPRSLSRLRALTRAEIDLGELEPAYENRYVELERERDKAVAARTHAELRAELATEASTRALYEAAALRSELGRVLERAEQARQDALERPNLAGILDMVFERLKAWLTRG